MRLIDADEFKRQIAGMAIINNYSADKANQFCELVDLQPTAYDVDAVVEQLKSEGCILDDEAGNRAVEIVEGGGSQCKY
ncbi:MAG: hypothetical protein Q4E91_06190 [Lachnospiraceae bacterium]|nr:hypothetical protein [Lachnospiraceae bacterium]